MSIVVEDLSFNYDETPILERVNLTVAKGHFIGIFGPNGGGKTTFLKVLIGLLKPKKGNLSLCGFKPKLARDQIGYVPQIKQFDKQFPITTLEVVLQGALSKLTGWGSYPKETKDKARFLLEKMSLLHKEKTAFGTLSGGEMQRVLIARALVSSPQILLLDEATTHIDLTVQRQVMDLLLSFKGKMTILMISHDLQLIVNEADLLFCMNRQLTSYQREEICRHFSIGLYHPKDRDA